MTADSKIQWTDKTWNPVRGCSRVSAGCRHCYAEGVAARFSGPGLPYDGLAERRLKVLQDGTERLEPRWTGKVRFIPEKLTEPLRWRKPARVFVNSMSDLFHDGVHDAQIAMVFAVMALAPQHTFQVLTKRPQRMVRWFTERRANIDVYNAAAKLIDGDWSRMPGDMANTRSSGGSWWPLRNVHIGVSIEDQRAADERIPLLLQTPAALRFLSCEPLLERVDLHRIAAGDGKHASALQAHHDDNFYEFDASVDWVIVGGESGPGARPFDIAWARDIVGQCKRAGVACFVKQLGAHVHWDGDDHDTDDGPIGVLCDHGGPRVMLRDRKGGDMSEWPADLRVREFPEVRHG